MMITFLPPIQIIPLSAFQNLENTVYCIYLLIRQMLIEHLLFAGAHPGPADTAVNKPDTNRCLYGADIAVRTTDKEQMHRGSVAMIT